MQREAGNKHAIHVVSATLDAGPRACVSAGLRVQTSDAARFSPRHVAPDSTHSVSSATLPHASKRVFQNRS